MRGGARQCSANGQDNAMQGWGTARRDRARGRITQCKAGARQGGAGKRKARHGKEGQGGARQDNAMQGWGTARRGREAQGKAWRGRPVQGKKRQRSAREDELGGARRGIARYGRARRSRALP